MMDINNLDKELEDFGVMMNYFSDQEKVERFPVLLQLKYFEAIAEFAERIKPIYVSALMLRGE